MMLKQINLADYQSILCLNGDLPPPELFRKFADVPVIAADGAANQLAKIQVPVHRVIGDLDSLHKDLHSHYDLLHRPSQDSSDFQKCLSYLEQYGLLPALIVGINGGKIDHILNNINIFLGTGCVLYAPPVIGFVLEEEQAKELHLPLETKISLMGIPTSEVSSQGLIWELDHTALSFPGQTSCFNRSCAPMVQIMNHSGKTLILIYEKPCLDAALFARKEDTG